jgi:hypothetical protein
MAAVNGRVSVGTTVSTFAKNVYVLIIIIIIIIISNSSISGARNRVVA